MGSLNFAAASIKTGVEKRICLFGFHLLARPKIEWITAILILVIASSASFISDHALAFMFLPIAKDDRVAKSANYFWWFLGFTFIGVELVLSKGVK